ncbi:MAG: hypothetical protein SFW36_12775 [Leptolyngbyaceae cyanobacterium bins.59]|nr:hypothetical protein [Leptolyngbyaceae cyanobacterium bins.59]
MQTLLWFVVASIGGTAAILGTLMTLGSLLLWFIPLSAEKGTRTDWLQRLKLLAFAGSLAFSGFALLRLIPFPSVS